MSHVSDELCLHGEKGSQSQRNAGWAHCPALHPSEMLTYAFWGEMDQQMVPNPFSTENIIYLS